MSHFGLSKFAAGKHRRCIPQRHTCGSTCVLRSIFSSVLSKAAGRRSRSKLTAFWRERRYGGIFAIGMAYRGTANNAAIQRLLHFAVSDVSDNVRRAAVMNLGFLLMGVPKQCPKIVSLLSESYNPHVRYGEHLSSRIRLLLVEHSSVSEQAAGRRKKILVRVPPVMG